MSEHDDKVGSAGEEAMKLFGALADWAKEHGSDLGHGVSGVAAHAARTAEEINEHLATGSADCTYCPICRTVHLVRELSPEVKSHLAVAGSSLIQAAAALLATAVPDERDSGTGRSKPRQPDVEHIDLDGEWPQ